MVQRGGTGLKKISLQDSYFQGMTKIHEGERCQVFRLKDGSILKLFTQYGKNLYQACGVDLEHKIMSTTKIKKVPEIIRPLMGVYTDKIFQGYIMDPASGISLSEYMKRQTKSEMEDLGKYGEILERLENIMRRANEQNVLFPNLCNFNHIYIDGLGNISLINYEGLQVRDGYVIESSNLMGNRDCIARQKYRTGMAFTPEIDKLGLVFLFFYMTFQIDLSSVGEIIPYTGNKITLEEMFKAIHLDDEKLMHKVADTLSHDKPGFYIAEDVKKLSEKYELKVVDRLSPTRAMKRLVKR